MARVPALAVLAVTMGAAAADGYFDGKTAPMGGGPACAGSGMEVTFRVTPDGEVLGGVVTFQVAAGDEIRGAAVIPISSDGFRTNLDRNGAMHASLHAGRHADVVTIDGVLSGGRFEGVVRRAGCRFRLSLDRR